MEYVLRIGAFVLVAAAALNLCILASGSTVEKTTVEGNEGSWAKRESVARWMRVLALAAILLVYVLALEDTCGLIGVWAGIWDS